MLFALPTCRSASPLSGAFTFPLREGVHSFIGPLNDDWLCTGHGTHGRWHTPGLGVDRLAEGSPHETSITKQSMRREVGMDRGLWRMYPRSTAEFQAGAPKPF